MLRTHRTPTGFIGPCLPTPAEHPPSGPGWIHEIKHDGFRLMVRRDVTGVRLLTRNGLDWSDRFPLIAEAAGALVARSFLIDGEAVACDGASGLNLRSRRAHSHAPRARQDAPMSNKKHVALLKKGVAAWNKWREEKPDTLPDLSGADLSDADLSGVDLRRASLTGANLSGADLSDADLSGVNLNRANLTGANLSGAALYWANLIRANLIRADLSGAKLTEADLVRADLSEAKLREANLVGAMLLNTDLTGADLTNCRIYGVSAWNLKLDGETKQQNLVITREDEPAITVDDIEVAQFVYLMLNNQKVRHVIDAITSKVVLILGRFTEERKPVLEALRKELRHREYLPILFDFEKPRSRTTDETVTLLARMARFVVADISDAKSVLQELRAMVPDLPSVPVQPIILAMQEEPGMFDFYRNIPWFLHVYRYASQEQLIADLGEKVIRPAELKVLDLQGST